MKVSDPVKVQTIFDLPNPDDKVENPVAEALKELNETLKTIRNIMQKWTMPIGDWGAAINQFAIIFEERVPLK